MFKNNDMTIEHHAIPEDKVPADILQKAVKDIEDNTRNINKAYKQIHVGIGFGVGLYLGILIGTIAYICMYQ